CGRSLACASGLCERRHDRRISPHRPSDATFDEILKSLIPPRPLIMPPGRIEDAPLPVRAHPRPRFFLITLLAIFEHRAVAFIVLRVHISLVPTFKTTKPAHDRMLGLYQRRPKRPSLMTLELRP